MYEVLCTDRDLYELASGNQVLAVTLAITNNTKRFSDYGKFVTYEFYTNIPGYHTSRRDVFGYLRLCCEMFRKGYSIRELERKRSI
jgi:hypothetical protein